MNTWLACIGMVIKLDIHTLYANTFIMKFTFSNLCSTVRVYQNKTAVFLQQSPMLKLTAVRVINVRSLEQNYNYIPQ